MGREEVREDPLYFAATAETGAGNPTYDRADSDHAYDTTSEACCSPDHPPCPPVPVVSHAV